MKEINEIKITRQDEGFYVDVVHNDRAGTSCFCKDEKKLIKCIKMFSKDI